jgi:fermentation-respiration switch protein FrsA (DUF1100 family)
MSAYTSIKGIISDFFFTAGKFASWLLKERFNNIEYIENVKCPALFIHGKADKLISYQHSKTLANKLIERQNNNIM